jgi:tRNA(Ile)-lysidine synthase
MKKLSPKAFKVLFIKHIWSFLGNIAKPSELKRSHAIAVSGGVDSMTLLWLAQTLHREGKIGPVRALFVHHHTRSGQDQEASLVLDYCQQLGVECKVLHIEGLKAETSNFEKLARTLRKNIVKDELTKGELLWEGHHLDDSYEWHMMQKSRSNHLKAILGIPARNGVITRPFLCVTKNQIQRLARMENIPFAEDPTNKDLKFDRNYVRHEIIPAIKKRYPDYLKHYAHLSNFTAILLKMSLSKGSTAGIYVYEHGAVLVGTHFSEIQLQEIIHTYSNSDRGEIVGPIQRMLKAIGNGKKGPFHFSGGMEAYYSSGILMIYRQGMKNYDENIANVLNHLSPNQLNNMPAYDRDELHHSWNHLLKTPDAMLNMPGLVLVLESESICKTLNSSVYDPLFPKISKICKEKGLRFVPYQKVLETWERKRSKLPKKLRLLPLSNLSNLFSSQ